MTSDSRGGAGQQGAYLYWDEEWRAEGAIGDWSVPEPWVVSVLRSRLGPHTPRVLDLGCGMGRHSVAFGKAGLEVHAMDLSGGAVTATRKQADRTDLRIDVRVGDFRQLPFADGFFDYVLAWNAIYHGLRDQVAEAIGEVARVLRPSGLFQTTMLSKRNVEYAKGIEIGPDAWVQPDGPEDKPFPHVYSDEHDVLRLHPGFRLLTAFDEEHRTPGSYHWHLLFERAGQ